MRIPIHINLCCFPLATILELQSDGRIDSKSTKRFLAVSYTRHVNDLR